MHYLFKSITVKYQSIYDKRLLLMVNLHINIRVIVFNYISVKVDFKNCKVKFSLKLVISQIRKP